MYSDGFPITVCVTYVTVTDFPLQYVQHVQGCLLPVFLVCPSPLSYSSCQGKPYVYLKQELILSHPSEFFSFSGKDFPLVVDSSLCQVSSVCCINILKLARCYYFLENSPFSGPTVALSRPMKAISPNCYYPFLQISQNLYSHHCVVGYRTSVVSSCLYLSPIQP